MTALHVCATPITGPVGTPPCRTQLSDDPVGHGRHSSADDLTAVDPCASLPVVMKAMQSGRLVILERLPRGHRTAFLHRSATLPGSRWQAAWRESVLDLAWLSPGR